jgi:hypothetical protein
MHVRRRHFRQAACAVFILTAAWALIVAVSGGFTFRLGGLRISSRAAINPAIAAIGAAAAAWFLATAEDRRLAIAFVVDERGLRRLLGEPPRQLAPFVAIAAAVAVLAFGLHKGLFVAGGADAYGYVSQADLWARGSLIVRQPFARNMAWPNAAETLAPLGYRAYRASPHGTDIVPVYSPGVPMLMAVFKLAAGPHAVYWVVPLLGGLAVWTTFLAGSRFAGPLVGAAAAVLMASSPPFLFEVIAPASDVAATTWWTLAFALLLRAGRAATFAAGVAAGLGVLTRPNLAPLVIVPGALVVWLAFRAASPANAAADNRVASASGVSTAATSGLTFIAGALPAFAAVVLINWRLYGSPLTSGYGAASALYHWSYVWPNLHRYPRWLLDTQTPVVLLALIAPFVLPARVRSVIVAWICAIVVILALYLFWVPFDEWSYLRFILPVYPLLFVLTAAALTALLSPLTSVARWLPGWTLATGISVLAWHGVTYAIDRGVLVAWWAEQRYLETGTWVAAHLPERAVLVCMQHSGSGRYYSGRITVRYDLLAPANLDVVIDDLQRIGYHPYFVLDDWEEPIFRDRFGAHSARGRLDWPPIALIHSGRVRVYDVAER